MVGKVGSRALGVAYAQQGKICGAVRNRVAVGGGGMDREMESGDRQDGIS